jgi:hypothetical protein
VLNFESIWQRLDYDSVVVTKAGCYCICSTSSYLHRFKLMESAACPCKNGDQTTDHLLYQCTLLQQQREILKKNTQNAGIWPISKHELITKHLKSFLKFTNSIDFDEL